MEKIEVAAGLIEKDRKILIAKRRKDVHLPGFWEFPGGKREPGEDFKTCLAREIREELGVEVYVKDEVFSTTYDYPDRQVILHFFECEWKSGEPQSAGCQDFRWIDKPSLNECDFPPANFKLIQKLKHS